MNIAIHLRTTAGRWRIGRQSRSASGDDIRYSDTDRQGHINHAIFSTMYEAGRVNIVMSVQ